MLNSFKIFLIVCFPIWLIGNFLISPAANSKTIQHKVIIKHPGNKIPHDVILYEVQNEQGFPDKYYLDVKSVICLEEVCKVISVRIFWNEIGEYQKYELENNATLEKYEADLFEKEDYKKLHTIIQNPNSPFKETFIEDILTVVVDDGTGNLDAVSGATAIHLDEKDTVPGAALTCFTLWHWAHGDVVSIIKTITGQSVSQEKLFSFLSNENRTYFFVSLEALKEHKNYSNLFVEEVIRQALENNDLLKASIQYIETAPSDIYFSSIRKLYLKGNELQKIEAIRALIRTKTPINNDYLIPFSEEIKPSKSYQEVSLFLDLLEITNLKNEKITQNVITLLESDFLIARRAYYYLKNQSLDNNQLEKVTIFFDKFKDRL